MTGPRAPAQVAADIVRLVGGVVNVLTVSHCFVRLRPVLENPGLVNQRGLRALAEVVVVVEQQGQLQVALRHDLFAVHDATRTILDSTTSP